MSDEPVVIGRVTNPEELDLDPHTITLVGYKLEKGKPVEVSHDFRVRGMSPLGAQLDVITHTRADGGVAAPQIIDYVMDAVIPEDAEGLRAFMRDPDVMIEITTISDLYRHLQEYYGARPTRRSSNSSSSTGTGKRTSRDAARSKASTPSGSRSTKP